MLGFEKNNNTFSKTKGSAKRNIAIEVGDSKQADFMPQFKTAHWNNEVNFSIRLKDDDGENSYKGATVRELAGRVEWEKNGRTARMYEKDTGDEDGGFEFEVEFASKPASNVVAFSLQMKGLMFLYQNELTQDEITIGASRPENITGSYSVYHKTKKNNFSDVEYRTGKVFNIYRPWAEDADGVRVWCELNIDEASEEMTVTVPQDFLNTAAYPVLVDPTFGYTTIGGTNIGISNNYLFGDVHTSTDTETVDSMSMYLLATLPSNNVKMMIVDDTAKTIITNGITNSGVVPETAGWTDITFPTPPSVVASTIYVLCFIFDQISSNFYYDGGGDAWYDTSNSFTTPTDPIDGVDIGTYKVSIYATYTVAAAGNNSGFFAMM